MSAAQLGARNSRNLNAFICSLFGAVCALIFITPLAHAATIDPLLARVYRVLDARPCVRLLNRAGVVGCSTPLAGVRGVLRAARTAAELQALLASAASPSSSGSNDDVESRVAILIDASLAGVETYRAARDAFGARLAGIAVAAVPSQPASAVPPLPPSTVDAATPLAFYAPSPSAARFAWNVAAANNRNDSLIDDAFRFSIVQLDTNDTQHAWAAAATNEAALVADNTGGGAFAAQTMEFQYRMGARGTSLSCLADATCQPLGGHSVWTTLMTANTSRPAIVAGDERPIVAGVALLDALSLFHAPPPRAKSWAADVMPTPASGTVVVA